MKYVLAVLLLLCGTVNAQIYQPSSPSIYGENVKRLKPFEVLHLPVYISDSSLHTNDTSAQIRINNGVLQYHYGYWRSASDGGASIAYYDIDSIPDVDTCYTTTRSDGRIDTVCFTGGGGGSAGSSSRFGIEDVLGIQDRAVDMEQHEFGIHNSTDAYLQSDGTLEGLITRSLLSTSAFAESEPYTQMLTRKGGDIYSYLNLFADKLELTLNNTPNTLVIKTPLASDVQGTYTIPLSVSINGGVPVVATSDGNINLTVSGGSTPNLQAVTTVGNVTTDIIESFGLIVNGDNPANLVLSQYGSLGGGFGGSITFKSITDNTHVTLIAPQTSSVDYQSIILPNTTGTLAASVTINGTNYTAGTDGVIDIGTIGGGSNIYTSNGTIADVARTVNIDGNDLIFDYLGDGTNYFKLIQSGSQSTFQSYLDDGAGNTSSYVQYPNSVTSSQISGSNTSGVEFTTLGINLSSTDGSNTTQMQLKPYGEFNLTTTYGSIQTTPSGALGAGTYVVSPDNVSIFSTNSTANLLFVNGDSKGMYVIGATGELRLNGDTFTIATLPVYTSNALALSGGLVIGNLYRNGDDIKIVH